MNTMNPISKQHKAPVRIITAGSVDDGKSTLIGRLLFDTQAVLADQVRQLSATKHSRVIAHDADFDLALLTDGLSAEREQGITIDVAYRYFATAACKFILADAPGHEQYTRNLVTGASQADVAIILVDASRLSRDSGEVTLLPQTKRHSKIIRLLGLRHVIFAVNKMDLVQYSQEHFNAIELALISLQEKIGMAKAHILPIAALVGEGVVRAHQHMAWYHGKTLLSLLESIDAESPQSPLPLRLPVQWVARQEGSSASDFRGYLGTLAQGTLQVGERVLVMPQGTPSTIKSIYQANHPAEDNRVDRAEEGASIAVELENDVDVSRGDLLVSAAEPLPTLTKLIRVNLCWLADEPLSLSRKYALRLNTRTVMAKISAIVQVWDVVSLSHSEHHQGMQRNDVGVVTIALQSAILAQPFDQCRVTGALILIDPVSQHTVAAGMVMEAT